MGHGRCVPVYESADVAEIVGDLSDWNVRMASEAFPRMVFRFLDVSDLDYAPDYFDAGVSMNSLSPISWCAPTRHSPSRAVSSRSPPVPAD